MKNFLKHSWLVIIGCFALTIALAVPLLSITLENTIRKYMPTESDSYKRLLATEEKFGSMITIGVSLETSGDTIITPEYIGVVERITDRMEALDGVEDIDSLSCIDYVYSLDGGLAAEELVNDDYTGSAEDMKTIKAKVVDWQEMYNRVIIDDTFKITQIAATIDPSLNSTELIDLLHVIKGIAEEEVAGHDLEVRYYGDPVLSDSMSDFMIRDLTILVPLVALVVLISLYFSFHSVPGMLLPLITVLMATVWSCSMMAIFKVTFTIMASVIPVALIACGSAYGIHVITHYYAFLDKVEGAMTKEKHADAICAGLKDVWAAVLLAGITTVAGFISLVTSPMVPLRSFAVFTALGIVFSLLLSVTFIPAMLYVTPLDRVGKKIGGGRLSAKIRRKVQRDLERRGGKSTQEASGKTLYSLYHFFAGTKARLAVFSVVIIVCSIWGIKKIVIDTSLVNYFPMDSKFRRDITYIDERLAGTNSLYLVISGTSEYKEAVDKIGSLVAKKDYAAVRKAIARLPEYNGKNPAVADAVGAFSASLDFSEPQQDTESRIAEAYESLKAAAQESGNPEFVAAVEGMGPLAEKKNFRAMLKSVQKLPRHGEYSPEGLAATALKDALCYKDTVVRNAYLALQNEVMEDFHACLTQPEILKAADGLQDYLNENFDGIGKAVSFTTFVKRMNQIMHAPMFEELSDEDDFGSGEYADYGWDDSGDDWGDDDWGDSGDDWANDWGDEDWGDDASVADEADESAAKKDWVDPNIEYARRLKEKIPVEEMFDLFLSAYTAAGGKSATIEDMTLAMQKELNYKGMAYHEIPYDLDKYLASDFDGLSRMIQQYLTIYGGSLDRFTGNTDKDKLQPSTIRMQLQLRTHSTDETDDIIKAAQAYAAKHFPEGYKLEPTGNGEMELSMSNMVINSQCTSIIFSIVLVFAIIAISFKSPVAGVIGALPLAFTIMLNFMTMGLAGIHFDLVTSIIASVAIGVGIDYTIHFMESYRALRNASSNVEEVAMKTFAVSGHGIVTNALAVGLGFLVLVLSKFEILRYIGVLIAIVMFSSSFLAMTVIPGILNAFDPKFMQSKEERERNAAEDSRTEG